MNMKKILLKLLQLRAKAVVCHYKPKIVAVTGSVGKTSTREAVAIALAGSFAVRTPSKNYNNEFGLPFAILGEKNPGRNPVAWLGLFLRSFKKVTFPNLLVLEYGADKQGDIGDLCDIAAPNISIITAISPVHLANYKSLDELVAEKQSLAMRTSSDGLVVLNADDATVLAMKSSITSQVITYSIESDEQAERVTAEVTASKIIIETQPTICTRAIVKAFGEEAELVLKNCLGRSSISACLAAIAVAHQLGVSLADAVERLNKGMQPVAGRLNPLAGIRGSLILDDSYNAAPASMKAGLEVLHSFVPHRMEMRRIAVLGKMAELGSISRDEHIAVGKRVAEVANLFVAVGEEMKDAAQAAVEAGMAADCVVWFATPVEAGRYLDANVRPGDIVFCKGSQSARIEKAVKDIVADPLNAAKLLVRQEKYWLRH
jgi:UDP-N-acetylmuramoyl-tripeptide--D-alanyl-D-alanine ligase